MSVTTTLEHTVAIDASCEIVYGLWTTADGLSRWFGSAATVDRRIGGEIRVDVDDEHVMAGSFVALDPPNRVVFTFGWVEGELAPGASTVEVTIEPVGDGCHVRLRHAGLAVEFVESHAQGWSHFLAELADAPGSLA